MESLWEEKRLTTEDRNPQERADIGMSDSRKSMRVLRSVQVTTAWLGVHGVSDVVKMHGAPPFPVEYKRGSPRVHRAAEVELCAQALCPKKMTEKEVRKGTLFCGARRRRLVVGFDADLQSLTSKVALEARAAINSGTLPAPAFETERRENRSPKPLCRPQPPRTA